MARAVVTVKQTSSPSVAFRRLTELSKDKAFLQKTKTIIESVHYSFGASDLFACLYAPCWGDFAVAVIEIADELDRAKEAVAGGRAVPRTVTNTILGLGEPTDGPPLESAWIAAAKLRSVMSQHPELEVDQSVLELVGREYVGEMAQRLIMLVKNLQDLGVLRAIQPQDMTALADLRSRLQIKT
jgi:hypothetical protein